MNKIVEKELLNNNVVKLVISAPRIAQKRKAGHFVILKINKHGERIPLTIADADPSAGTITLVIQKVGVTSHKLFLMKEGDTIADVVGPLGHATEVSKVGTVLCAGGGVGIAPLLPIARAFKEVGNRVVSVLAARSRDLIILEQEMQACSDELIIMTDDGSYGKQGLVTHGMEEFLEREKINLAVTIGPAIMMKFASLTTKKYNVPTIASLNTIMMDGTGMCGACRVTVDGKTKFVCVDGPEFDAHKIDYDEMIMRLGAYEDQENTDYEKFLKSLEK
ncbi:MAG: sulfide/dihydroorotate dehydrogenase-like FAD/NAD-binding protein [Bacteroidales bacterium]|nr:sulfide/dihydroorotate dehydrogenase-like FAD/NAD-binding protein [Bacteroidales bacterium]